VILTDTGPIVAILDADDAHHRACTSLLPMLQGPLLTTTPCFVEAMYLVYRAAGYPGQEMLWDLRRRNVLAVRSLTDIELDRTAVLMEQYRDSPMDFADASLVVAAEALGTTRLFTLDSHFYGYRINGKAPFDVIP
jgi:predicted nucleic acid-binding protein